MANDNQPTVYAKDQAGNVIGLDLVAGRIEDMEPEAWRALLVATGKHVREVERCNCPTCGTVGVAGAGEACWNCQGRGWVEYPLPDPSADECWDGPVCSDCGSPQASSEVADCKLCRGGAFAGSPVVGPASTPVR